MQVKLIDPGELGSVEIAAWHSMQRATPSLFNPFLSPEFAMAVGGFRSDARIAVLTKDRSITGFFPFERRRLGVGVPICGWLSPCQGIVHAPGANWDTRELLQGCRLSAWQFDNLIVDQQPFKPYHAATAPSPIIDLADGFDSYYAKLQTNSPRFCKELARKTRKLGREVGDLRIITDSRDTSLLSVLYAGDQPVAGQFGLRAENLLVGWFTAYDIRFREYSPGLIQLMQTAEKLAATGLQEIHMGKGAKNFTQQLKNSDIPLAEGIVTRRSLLGSAHRAYDASARWSVRTVRHHPGLHRNADRILRRSGVSRLTYGRM